MRLAISREVFITAAVTGAGATAERSPHVPRSPRQIAASAIEAARAGAAVVHCALGRNEMPYVAAAVLAGGNVRVGLEDNLYLERGVLATNAQLVERAVAIIESLGAPRWSARSACASCWS